MKEINSQIESAVVLCIPLVAISINRSISHRIHALGAYSRYLQQ